MPCGCQGRRRPDPQNEKRQAQTAERRAAVEAARRMIAEGRVPEFTRHR